MNPDPASVSPFRIILPYPVLVKAVTRPHHVALGNGNLQLAEDGELKHLLTKWLDLGVTIG
jgi:hypothetical protein